MVSQGAWPIEGACCIEVEGGKGCGGGGGQKGLQGASDEGAIVRAWESVQEEQHTLWKRNSGLVDE